jgi:hypothetical protein
MWGTPDLYRVNFEVNNLKPFPYLAFPHLIGLKTPQERLSFDGELMASFPEFSDYSRLLERRCYASDRYAAVFLGLPKNKT